jgi:hypothetical protein
MVKNTGAIDRRIRAFVIAPLLLLAGWALGFGTIGGVIATVLAAVMVGTATLGFCPLYLPLHINTDHEAAKVG